MGDNYDIILRRLLSGEANFWVEVLTVDDEPAANHKVLLQLGNDPARYYLYAKGTFKEVDKSQLKVESK